MHLHLDPELAAVMAPMAAAIASLPPLPAKDPHALRQRLQSFLVASDRPATETLGISSKKHYTTAPDGHIITITEFRRLSPPAPTQNTKAIYHIHGGGMILGSVDILSSSIIRRVRETGVPSFAVSYRLAPEFPDPIPVTDCYAGLTWLSSNASSLGIDPAKIVILGESAGGGLSAGCTLMARDQGLTPPLRKQILIYPMLDDRNVEELPNIAPLANWTADYNLTCWTALLGSKRGTDEVSPYAAPARARLEALTGLPMTYIDCGALDIFVHESVDFAARLMQAGVQCELHVYPGQVHGFDGYAPDAEGTQAAFSNVRRAILSA